MFLQAAVIKKFLQGFMAPKQKKRKAHQSEEAAAKAEEQDEEKRMAEEAKVLCPGCRRFLINLWIVK